MTVRTDRHGVLIGPAEHPDDTYTGVVPNISASMATEAVTTEATERVPGETASRWVLLVIGVVFLGIGLAQSPGLIEYDTKLPTGRVTNQLLRIPCCICGTRPSSEEPSSRAQAS